jgi:beta-glucosidase
VAPNYSIEQMNIFHLRRTGPAGSKTFLTAFTTISTTALLSLRFCSPAFAADETCGSCGQQVSVTGDFEHRKDEPSVGIQGATNGAAAVREEINGKNFSVIIAHLPAGNYTVTIGEAETLARGPGERLFDVTCGEARLAGNFDIFATAGDARKVCYIHGVVEHQDDSLKGPLTLTFSADQGVAKFNTVEVRDPSGASVVSFSASEMAGPFMAAAVRVPQISDPPIWRAPSKPLKARADDLIRRMSLAEKVAQLQNGAPAIQRLGFPAYNYWSEALHGVANNGIATVFPQAIGMASTWNASLIHEESAIIGVEGRAKFNDYAAKHNGDAKWFGGLTFWSPNINIFRDPRWGRGQETYGEDPFLSGTIGVEFIRGLQGDDPNYLLAVGCAKHFAVHSGPEPERHRFDAVPSDRDLYETYLPQFEMAVREGHVGGVMGAYNSLFGVPCCASTFLLGDLLRKQWGFDGYVVSDCDAIHNIWGPQEHHYVATPEDAAAAAVKAGCNLCCGRDYIALVRAAQQGLITEKEINQALYYTLWTRFRLGLFDPDEKCAYSKIGIDQNDTAEHRQIALQAARESLVLLKNDGLLPLNPSKIKRIAVFGQNAANQRMMWGNYNGTASRTVTIIDGIRQLATNLNLAVSYAQGCPIVNRSNATASLPSNEELRTEVISNAVNADVLIYVGGINSQLEGEEGNVSGAGGIEGFRNGDRTRIELPQVQEDFVRVLHATGKPLIMVNCSGSAMALPWEAEHLPAILQAWYPGEAGGRAVAEVLFGDVNPSGHLPLTFYRSTADLPEFTDYSMANRTYRYFSGKPLFAFGHGLSYTKFDFQDAELGSKKMAAGDTAKLVFTVKNSGDREGDEVAQVYFRHVNSTVSQSKLALCGFTRVHLRPGESSKLIVEIPAQRLRYWDTAKKQYVVEPGDYEILVGAASDDIRLKLPMTILKL